MHCQLIVYQDLKVWFNSFTCNIELNQIAPDCACEVDFLKARCRTILFSY